MKNDHSLLVDELLCLDGPFMLICVAVFVLREYKVIPQFYNSLVNDENISFPCVRYPRNSSRELTIHH